MDTRARRVGIDFRFWETANSDRAYQVGKSTNIKKKKKWFVNVSMRNKKLSVRVTKNTKMRVAETYYERSEKVNINRPNLMIVSGWVGKFLKWA